MTLIKEFKKVFDIPSICKRICGMQERVGDWIHLIDSVSAIIEIGRVNEMMAKYVDTIPELVQMAPSLLQSEDICQLLYFLQQVFDYKQSIERKDICIRSGVDLTLDEMRSLYSKMPSLLEETSDQTNQCLAELGLPSGGYEFLPRSILE